MGKMVMRTRTVILMFYCIIGWIGLHADEAGIHVVEFCKKDPRFEKHLLHRNDINDKKNRLRKAKFRELANLISFVEDHKVNLLIRKGANEQINETYSSIEKNNESDDPDVQLDFVVHVNPRGDFASAYYATMRELIIARMIMENIHNGKITTSSSFEQFSEIYREIYNKVIKIIQNDFDLHDRDWCKSEGIETDVIMWKKHELSQISEEKGKLSKDVNIRAKLFFDSFKLIFDGA
jgi:hypothetical protein